MLLPKSDLFHGLSETHVRRLAAIATESPMETGQWLLHEGQDGDEFYVIKTGEVELMVKVDDDFHLPISVLRSPGQSFGTSALVAPYQYNISARCLEEGVLLVMKREHLQEIIRKDREIGWIIMSNVAQHVFARLNETRRELIIHYRSLLKSVQ